MTFTGSTWQFENKNLSVFNTDLLVKYVFLRNSALSSTSKPYTRVLGYWDFFICELLLQNCVMNFFFCSTFLSCLGNGWCGINSFTHTV